MQNFPDSTKAETDFQISRIRTARKIAANPEQFMDRPLLRRLAWSTLMTARGHRVNQTRLAQLQRGMA